MIFWSQTIFSLWALADTNRVTLIIGQVMWRLAAFQFTHKKKTCWGDGPSETQHFNFLTSLRPFTNFPTNFCHFEGLYEPCVNTSAPRCFRTSNQWRTQGDKLLNIQLSTKIPDSGLCLDTVYSLLLNTFLREKLKKQGRCVSVQLWMRCTVITHGKSRKTAKH